MSSIQIEPQGSPQAREPCVDWILPISSQTCITKIRVKPMENHILNTNPPFPNIQSQLVDSVLCARVLRFRAAVSGVSNRENTEEGIICCVVSISRALRFVMRVAEKLCKQLCSVGVLVFEERSAQQHFQTRLPSL